MKNIFFTLFLILLSKAVIAKTVKYELTVTKQSFNVTGKSVDFALTVNGGIPAPVLEFTEGDEAEVLVKNRIPDDDLSIHWHGILLPSNMDGVPNVTNAPILPGTDFLFKFKIRQHGTYWYHSHTNVQEQKGVYGAIVIHPKTETIKADREVVAVLSDWSDENATNILNNLKKDGDYYLYKKSTIRSYGGALQAGGLSTLLSNEWSRMGGMDFSDVGYDAFLINGKKDSQLVVAHPGEKVRVRIVNAAASSYFYVNLGNTPMKVISADGVDIEQMFAKDLLMGMAETYDILFTVPEHKNYELKITAQDGTGSASGWIGMKDKVYAAVRPAIDLYAGMDHSAMGDMGAMPGMNHESMDHSKMNHAAPPAADVVVDHSKMDHSQMNHAPVKIENENLNSVQTANVDELKAKDKFKLPVNAKVHEMKFVLDGDMRRYVWHLNGKAISEDRTVEINEGDVVRFIYENKSMMHHPMHLHGHFFRVKNKYGEYSPLKHTVDVPPHSTRVIEFVADEPGEWMLHCHNLFHMKTGMARVIKYKGYQPAPEIAAIQKYDHHLHDHWYSYGRIDAATNHAQGKFKTSQTWNQIDGRIEARKDDDWKAEGDLFLRRWNDNYLNFIVGGMYQHNQTRAVAGVGYLLPMLIETNLLVDHKGKLRIDVEKKFQWTQTLFTEAEYSWRSDSELDSETLLSLMYGNNWSWAAGVKYTGNSFGVGFQYQF